MKLERLLQINLATLTALGALLLGLGQNDLSLPFLALLAAVGSVVFTDVLGWFALNRNVANLAAVAAVALSLTKFFNLESEMQLLAIANLLVYLQAVLLFQEKNGRVYWQLCVLSLLQVVVASALHLGMSFGLMLLIYMVLAFSALTFFYLYREQNRFRRARRRARRAQRAVAAGQSKPRNRLQFRADGVGDVASRIPRRATTGHVIRLSLVSLAVSVVFFYSVPRIRNDAWAGAGASAITGFSENVSLGEMRRVLKKDGLVMRVEFLDAETRQPVRPTKNPYFRGAALASYDSDGHWSRVRVRGRDKPQEIELPPAQVQLTQQRIRLENSPDGVVFAVAPAYRDRASTPKRLRVDPRTGRLAWRRYQRPRGRVQYELLTDAFVQGDQLKAIAAGAPPSKACNEWRNLIQIKALADRVVSEAGIDPNKKVEVARALENHLSTSPLYSYTLDPRRPRNRKADPVEDFLFNYREGHCQHFAGALALMLRTQGVPSRVVVGYAGSEYNRVGDYHQVKQHHAHAWVEAHFQMHELPLGTRIAGLPPGGDKSDGENGERAARGAHGVWLRLDPTPPARDEILAASNSGLLDRLSEWLDYLQMLWADYVLELNSDRQQAAIYEPLKERLSSFFRDLFSAQAWRDKLNQWAEDLGIDREGLLSGRWFNWRAGLAASLAVLFLVLLVRGMIRLVRWTRRRFTGGRATAQRRERPIIDFYRDLEALLEKAGFERPPGQTQREFAVSVAGQLAESPASQPVSGLPRQIVEMFYRVRFGGKTLDPRQQESVQSALAELRQSLAEEQAPRGATA